MNWNGADKVYTVYGNTMTPATQALRDALNAARSHAFAIKPA